ncbi:MAG TPA: hypothetical protein VFO29_12795 [Candidatus Rubrimentiphilum sp.]|nr:hypothetical protein [Candidatus Rubrimentiphilum sp.]
MKNLRFGLLAIVALVVALPAVALADGLYITGVDPLLVKNAGGCKKVDSAVVRCGIRHGQYTYVYFEAQRPKFEQCTLSVSRGPGERWHVDASPCIARWNGDHVYISVPKRR